MSELWALLPSVLAHGIHDRLTRMARSVKDAAHGEGGDAWVDSADGDGDVAVPEGVRTMDQLRADALCDLALTGHPTLASIDRSGGEGIDALQAIVQITVPFQTLVGDEGPAPVLTGRGPIDPESARRLLGAATLWDRVLTDPVSGDVLAVDRRFPTEAQRRHLRARDEHCRFPGAACLCGVPTSTTRSTTSTADRAHEPRAPVPATSHAEAPHPVAGRAARRWCARVDEPWGPELHRPSVAGRAVRRPDLGRPVGSDHRHGAGRSSARSLSSGKCGSS
nr:hypothetical protein GCM10025699_11660 [Microbacterium flavescens]